MSTDQKHYKVMLVEQAIANLETLELWGKRDITTQMIKDLKLLLPIIEQEVAESKNWIEQELKKK